MSKDLRSQIFASNDLPTEKVIVPEWNDVVIYIRSMSAKERDDWQFSRMVEDAEEGKTMSMENLSASMLVKVLCSDKEGKKRIFKDDDVELLGNKSASALNRLSEAAKKLNGVTKEDEENMLKNSSGLEENSGSTRPESVEG